MCLSACLSSSPTISTTDVVPSPVISSCAVAARAIMTFWKLVSRTWFALDMSYGSRVLDLLDKLVSRQTGSDENTALTISFKSTFPSLVSLIYSDININACLIQYFLRQRRTPPAPSTSLIKVFESAQPMSHFLSREALHLDCPRGTKVRLEHILQAFSGADVHLEGFSSPLQLLSVCASGGASDNSYSGLRLGIE